MATKTQNEDQVVTENYVDSLLKVAIALTTNSA